VIVGSGFGGSVTALRLAEKGYRVAVLEAGDRFDESTYARTSWDLRRFLFAPRLGCYGIQRIDALDNVLILSGAGVGGGSLVYANTLYKPPQEYFDDPHWSGITDWRDELAPHYDQAGRMLGVVVNPLRTPADDAMEEVARQMGVGHTFGPTPVGVYFGRPGAEVDDPYFGGIGPSRRGCIGCGACMTGCRYGAKNTLTKNYLFLAEQAGVVVHPLTTVEVVRPVPAGGYAVDVRHTRRRRARTTFSAEQVVFAAGALGTQRLLHRLRDTGVLPMLSSRLGSLTRTNSESLLGAIAPDRSIDYSQGLAITSSFHPDPQTHVEPVRYGAGSNAMALLQTVLVEPDEGRRPWSAWLRELWSQRRSIPALYDVQHWSERAIIALVMQSLDNSITTYGRRNPVTGRWRLASRQGHGAPNPSWIPAGHEAVRRLAQLLGGTAGGSIGEPFGIPMTAHFLGGAVIGESAADGVVDPWHRVHGYPGLHIVDGSTISANLGVNPSLTIMAQAERAMSFWPNRGAADPRPAPGSAYRRIPAVPPRHPVVPAGAPGALRRPADVSR
jgi:cholesterol oxidase